MKIASDKYEREREKVPSGPPRVPAVDDTSEQHNTRRRQSFNRSEFARAIVALAKVDIVRLVSTNLSIGDEATRDREN